MNELKTRTEKTTDGAPKRNPWRRLPKGGKIAVIVVGILAVLAVLAALYVNGKLDLLRYDDGSVSEMGEIGADEDQDLDGTGLTHTESEMTMPEGSPFSDDNVLNILLIGTDERTEAVNDADAFTHLNQLDGTEDTTEFSDDARPDSMILVSLDIQGSRHPAGLHRARHPACRFYWTAMRASTTGSPTLSATAAQS